MCSIKPTLLLFLTIGLSACEMNGGYGSYSRSRDVNIANPENIDTQLAGLIQKEDLTGLPAQGRDIPNINDPLPKLGKLLFFSKSLSGNFDVACASCHHPALGGDDDLSLPIGAGVNVPDMLGQGRGYGQALPQIPRSAPTVFNVALNDGGFFWDSRAKNLQTQAAMPVTSDIEMQGEIFESGSQHQQVKEHIAARIGGYGQGVAELEENNWLPYFQRAFESDLSAESLITFENIARALAAYQRSLTFVNNSWNQYIQGNLNALSYQQKAGAVLFLTSARQGGAGCAECHSGDTLSDNEHHVIAFPQIGPGIHAATQQDTGRYAETGHFSDRYKFRTPSLLNVAMTAPYGHSGSYQSLSDVVAHYHNPRSRITRYFQTREWCQLDQFVDVENCADLYPNAAENTWQAYRRELKTSAYKRRYGRRGRGPRPQREASPFPNIRLSPREQQQVVSFLQALTDPCVENRECLSPWIADPESDGPDGQQLNAVNEEGVLL